MSTLSETRFTSRERLQAAGVVTGVSLLLALFETSRNYLLNAIGGRSISWLASFQSSVPPWMIMAALTPLPLMLARRVPLAGAPRGRALVLHAAGALVFSALHAFGMAAYIGWQRASFADFWILLPKTSGSIGVNLMLYAAIVGAVNALRFFREAQARAVAASQLQASLTEARLTALRGQLNPHFLFNTLNAISTMALKREHENVVRTLGYLGELLRVSLDDRMPQQVPLSEELAFLERYLDIQRIRFADRLHIDIDIAPDTADALVPSMLLQPFVENAVTHGIARLPGPGTIGIRAHRRDNSLVIDVTDTGPGFESRAGATGAPAPGIGLSNTRARLAQLYGDAFTIECGANGAAGARVSVVIPFRRAAPTVDTRQA
jgi:two-component system LytT family sensor kinase